MEHECICNETGSKRWGDIEVDTMCIACINRWGTSERAVDCVEVSAFTGATSSERCAGEPRSPTAAMLNGQSAAHNCRSMAGTRRVPIVATLRAVDAKSICHVSRCNFDVSVDSALHSRRRRSVRRNTVQRETGCNIYCNDFMTRIAAQASLTSPSV